MVAIYSHVYLQQILSAILTRRVIAYLAGRGYHQIMPWQDFPIFNEIDTHYGEERTLEDFYSWFIETNGQLKAVACSGDENARKRIDGRKNCLKNFYEEAFPIETFLKSGRFSDIRFVRLNPGSEPWDAKLTSHLGAVTQIEVTSTIDGEADKVAMAFLRKFKRSPSRFFHKSKRALWDIFKTNEILPDDVFQAYKLTEEIASQAERVIEVIAQKAGKIYGANTILLVYLDNVDAELDLGEVKRQLPDSELKKAKLVFTGIYLVRYRNPAVLLL